MTITRSPSVLILGAGLAGLATAYELIRVGHSVTVLEHSAWRQNALAYDVGAGLFLQGCESETWRLLSLLHSQPMSLHHRRLPFEFELPGGRLAAPYRPAHLPGSLQWILGLMRFSGLAWTDRWRLFSFVEQLWEDTQQLPADLDSRPAEEWLHHIGQSGPACETVWGPLALRLSGNRLDRLSAAVWVETMARTFLGRAADATLTGISGTVAEVLVAPLREAVFRAAVRTRCSGDIPVMTFTEDRVSGVRLGDGSCVQADWYITALDPEQCRALFPERLLSRWAYFSHITELTLLSEVVVRMVCRGRLHRPRLLLCGPSPFHELALTPHGDDRFECRLTASDVGSTTSMDDAELGNCSRGHLRTLYPDVRPDDIQHIEITRDPGAVLSLPPGASRLRPVQQSPIRNLLLAGAWTDTGWPARTESALVSARRCAMLTTRAAA